MQRQPPHAVQGVRVVDARRFVAVLIFAAGATVCGGSSTDPGGNGGTGSAKVLTATINGQAFTGVTVNAAYLNGSLTINGVNASRSISINAINVTGPGTIALGIGNPWSALAGVVDGNLGIFSSGYGGTGTVTLTTATLGRVTGTFTFTGYTSAGTGAGKPVVTVLNGVFDITNP